MHFCCRHNEQNYQTCHFERKSSSLIKLIFTPSAPENVQLFQKRRLIEGDGIHIWEKAAGSHMFAPYRHNKAGRFSEAFQNSSFFFSKRKRRKKK